MISFVRLGFLVSLLLPTQVGAGEIEHVLAHPPYAGYYVCGEHYQDQLPYLGDKVHINPVVNEPGILGKPPASFITLRRDDGVMFMLAHIQEPSVEAGEDISYGQPIALVGNKMLAKIRHCEGLTIRSSRTQALGRMGRSS